MNESRQDANAATVPVHRGRLVLGFFALLAAIVLWGLWKVLESFVTPILLAGVIVVLTFPLYDRLRRRMGGRERTASLLMLIGVNLVIILPAAVLIVLLIDQATALVAVLQKTNVTEVVSATHLTERVQRLLPGVRLPNIDIQGALLSILRQLPGVVATNGAAVLAGFADIVIGFFFMLFAIFYFYCDGEKLLEQLKYLSPLPNRYNEEMLLKFKHVIDSTFRGHVLTAVAQGLLTAIGIAICGIPGAAFWGAVATVFSLLPLVGAAIVWVPAAIYLFLDAAYHGAGMGWAIFMVIWGAGPVSVVDNFIRPWAMKGGADMPAVLLLFSVLGGVRAFGFMGILLGPLIFALLVSVIDIYKEFFRTTLDAQSEAQES